MKARILWILVAVALLGGIAARVASVKKEQEKPVEVQTRATLVQVTPVKRDAMDEKIMFTGTIRPKNEVDVFTKQPGRIETLTVDVGDKVKLGQLLATVEHKEIGWQSKAADAALDVAKANLASAKLDFERTQTLFKGGSAAQSQLDGAKTRLALAEAQVAQAEASAGLARQQVDNSRVESPINGTIVRRQANLGMQAGVQAPLFTIQDVNTLKLESSVDAVAYTRLKKGADADVMVDARPNEHFPAKVTLLSPTLDSNTRRASVELEIDNASGKLLPNMFATANVIVGRVENALVIPKDSVLMAAGGATVYRVKDNKAEMLHPKIGAQDGDRFQVLSDLNDGDLVVVGGVAAMADGIPVKVAPSTQGAGAMTQKE